MAKKMSRKRRERLAIGAAMEGEATVAANIGDQIPCSEMELIALCTFAEIGIMSIFSKLEGQNGENASSSLDRTLAAVRETFSSPSRDGVGRLTQTVAALLRGEKFSRYLPIHDAEDTPDAQQ